MKKRNGIFGFFKRKPRVGDTIVHFVGEGCQAVGKFEWVGKVIDYQNNKEKGWKEIVIQIIKKDWSYYDIRDEAQGIYTYPMVNNDIQYVGGVWILFT